MSRLFFVGFVVALSTTAFATNTWYVAKEDPAAANTLDEGRGSEALPFRTIQAALDNPAFEAHDIVLVKRGDYDEGGVLCKRLIQHDKPRLHLEDCSSQGG